ncbi:transposase [Micromonospora sp. WMMD734]|uniref:transposase n=1 Tax=Micromonospora sp. WMMD734 TaxID=3404129 RepID=UPI003B9403BB
MASHAGRAAERFTAPRPARALAPIGHHDRCHAGGVHDTKFATKLELAAQMITAALDAGVAAGWVAADEAYGNSAAFRAGLREHQIRNVLAVSRSHLVRSTAVRLGSVPR